MDRIKLWWAVRKCVEHIQVITVPADSYIFMTVTPELPDVDMERLRTELREFFGANRKVAIVRAGDVQWSVLTFEETHAND